ncbi:hypothetical protein CSIRO_3070 [Bradyrhizobiaceae bacterium SG-6C]|nr:hypothetical protein CSIRO_3070 [Bradyrhizobiaceae bacterium SG-6C]
MAKQDARNDEILQDVKAAFEADVCAEPYVKWFDEAVESFGFYETWGQWTQEEREQLKNVMAIAPVTVNKIAPRLNNVAGAEIQTRTRIVFRARSFDKGEQQTAEALSDLAMFVQDKNNSPHIMSHVGHDSRICGVGLHEFDVQNGVIYEARRNPLEGVWDSRDRTPGMSNQGRFSLLNWMSRAEAKEMFPDKADELDQDTGWDLGLKCASNTMRLRAGYRDRNADELLIVEHFYRTPCKYYECVTRGMKLVTTFDEKEARQMSRMRPGTRVRDYETKNGYKVSIAYFTGNVLLELVEDAYQLNPAKGLFLVTPTICFRETNTGIPYGLIRAAKDPQRLYNKTKTRIAWLMASHQVIMEGDAADESKVRSEAAKPDGVLIKKAGKELTINRHENAISQGLEVALSYDRDIQDALGVYDENVGKQTNVTSGVGINSRKAGGDRNQELAKDNVLAMNKRRAEKLLYLVQSVFTEQTAFWVTDDKGEAKQVMLNEPVLGDDNKPVLDKHGEPVLKCDIKTGVYDLYVEEVPDLSTQIQVARQELSALAQSSGGFQNITPGMAEFYGVPKSSALMAELQSGAPAALATRNAQAQSLVGGQAPTNSATQAGTMVVQ